MKSFTEFCAEKLAEAGFNQNLGAGYNAGFEDTPDSEVEPTLPRRFNKGREIRLPNQVLDRIPSRTGYIPTEEEEDEQGISREKPVQ